MDSKRAHLNRERTLADTDFRVWLHDQYTEAYAKMNIEEILKVLAYSSLATAYQAYKEYDYERNPEFIQFVENKWQEAFTHMNLAEVAIGLGHKSLKEMIDLYEEELAEEDVDEEEEE